MPCFPFFASRLASVSVLTGITSLVLGLASGCSDSAPSTSGAATTSAGGASATAATSSSGSGGDASSSSVSTGASGGASSASSSGAGGSSAASGSSSSASGSSGASSSSSTGSGSAGGLGDPCTTAADCAAPPPNSMLFCDKPGCGAGPGTCALQPKSQLGLSQAAAPVCGCDHVTYWNAEYAAFHGISIAAQGACAAAGSIACSNTMPCPGTMKCNRLVADQAQCAPSADGTCWSMPVSAPSAARRPRPVAMDRASRCVTSSRARTRGGMTRRAL